MLSRLRTRALLWHRAWRYRLRLDPAEVKWMCRVLRPGDVALDIGAHKGAYTYWIRRSVGAAGRVIAFEPQPELATYLTSCVEAFDWGNVVVEGMGLSSGSGQATLHVPGRGPSPGATLVAGASDASARKVSVPVSTLDRYLGGHPLGGPVRFIKIDVEGHELEVFHGGAETLSRDKPLLLVECEQRHNASRSVASVFAFLGELGYRGFFTWHGREAPVAAFVPDVHQVYGQPDYVYNFVFVNAAG